MWALLLLAAAIAGWWHHRRRPAARRSRHRTLQRTTTALRHTIRRRPQHGAGASADAHARHLSGGLRNHLAAAVGITTRSHRQAANYRAGAEGERRTAALLAPLAERGWTFLDDRALPSRRSRTNLDHLAISPTGAVVLLDSKAWDCRYPLTVRRRRALHGRQDVTGRLSALAYETRTVSATLGVPVIPLVVMHGAPLHGQDGQPASELSLSGFRVRIIPADRIVAVLRSLDPSTTRTRAAQALAARARHQFPPHTHH